LPVLPEFNLALFALLLNYPWEVGQAPGDACETIWRGRAGTWERTVESTSKAGMGARDCGNKAKSDKERNPVDQTDPQKKNFHLPALRTARQGKKAGSRFWGCTGFPGRRGSRPREYPTDPSDPTDQHPGP